MEQRQIIVSAAYRPEQGKAIREHLDLLALAWSEERNRVVSRNEVLQALIEAALAEHPVTAEDARRLRQRSKQDRPRRAPPPRIRLIKDTAGKISVRESGDGGSFRAPKSIPLAA